MEKQTIKEFYSHQHIFITGATGFIGKLILEKILWSCPEVGKIYVLVRAKSGSTPEERWKETLKSMAFDRLKERNPEILENKIKVLAGNVKEKRLGLSDEDYKLLQDNVSIVIHSAASVRFNDPIHDAILSNVRSTNSVLELALGMKNIKVTVHISTTFSNPYLEETLEQVYPPPADWREALKLVDDIETKKREYSILSNKYIGSFPNTYTFTKNLAESMVWDYRNKLNLLIARPSVVISAISEPIPGFVDSYNGPFGLTLAVAIGLIRASLYQKDSKLDMIPVDVVVKAILVSAWKKVHCPREELPVYNIATAERNISLLEYSEMGCRIGERRPMINLIWFPVIIIFSNKSLFMKGSFIMNYLPSIVVDSILKRNGKQPMAMKIVQRAHVASLHLANFTNRQWHFQNNNFLELVYDISHPDMKDFQFDYKYEIVTKFSLNTIHMAKKIILKDDEDVNLEKAKVNYKRFKLLHYTVITSTYAFLIYMTYLYFF